MRTVVCTALIGLLVVGMGFVPLGAQAPPYTVDVLDYWNQQAAASIIAVAGQVPPVAALHLAMAHLAMYDAVAASTGRFRVFHPAISPAPGASPEAAAATAAHGVLVALFPSQRGDLDARLAQTLELVPAGRAKTLGLDLGSRVAQEVLQARAGDGRFASVPYVPASLSGFWRPTPPSFAGYVFPWIGAVRPFGLRLATQFRPPGPPAMDSSRYTQEFEEVKRLGSRTSTARTPEQREIALFWSEHASAQMNRAVVMLARTHRLPAVEKSRLFAMVWTSVADALVGCWNAKSYYSFWRPVSAIREASDDGNSATVADPAWEPLVPTAPFPEYPSGHGCATGAAVQAIETYFGTPAVPFVMDSTATNTVRRFEKVGDAIREVIEARIYIGYHFRSANVDGAALGRQTARYILERHFQPIMP